jgi:hypothetical protein
MSSFWGHYELHQKRVNLSVRSKGIDSYGLLLEACGNGHQNRHLCRLCEGVVKPITLVFNSKKTALAVYHIHLKDLKDSIVLAKDKPELLEEIRLDLLEILARIETFQERLR